ncbi:MAG: hypothetical protein NT018_00515 [Armatimonadetes bacterium]|nr:hypothetical protein [Armatimonadota bacterium]
MKNGILSNAILSCFGILMPKPAKNGILSNAILRFSCFGILMPKPASCALLLCMAAVLIPGTSYAKTPPDEQYANISPLPGGGTAINSDGESDGLGAMQINIPVAYTPGAGYANLGLYEGGYFDKDRGNGSGVYGMGFGTWPRLYVSGMAVSSIIFSDSKVFNAQFQFVKETDSTPALAIGAQDILNKEGADNKATTNTGIGYYGVATKRFKIGERDVYGVLGYGAGKFADSIFGGVSTPLSDKFTFTTEYDGYQFNTGLAWRPTGRKSPVTVLAAYDGQTGPLVGAQVTGNISGWWAIPVILLSLRN